MLSGLLQALLTYYPLDMMDATPALPGTEADGVPVEAWISIDGRGDAGLADLAPKWHIPSAEEVHFLPPLSCLQSKGAAQDAVIFLTGSHTDADVFPTR